MKIINWTGKLVKVRSLGTFPISNINKLIVHHDAQFRSSAYDNLSRWNAQARLHISQGQGRGGIQYHFKIDNIGGIYQLNPLGETLWHATNLDVNYHSIAICLDGYFHAPKNQKPTYEQYQALKWLLDTLSADKRFPANQDDVYGHREVAQLATACCGDNLIGFVRTYRKTKGNLAIPRVPRNDGTVPAIEPPKPTPTPPPPPTPPKPVVNKYVRYATPKVLITNKATKLWDFNKTGWDFNAVKSFKQGEEFIAVGEAQHSNGGVYQMTAYSFGQADKTGKPAFTQGVNIVDLSPKPTPPPVTEKPPVVIPEQPPVTESPPTDIPPEGADRKEVQNFVGFVEFIVGFLKRLSSRKFLLTLGTVAGADAVVDSSGLTGDVAGFVSVAAKVAAVITYIIVEGVKDIQEVKTPGA